MKRREREAMARAIARRQARDAALAEAVAPQFCSWCYRSTTSYTTRRTEGHPDVGAGTFRVRHYCRDVLECRRHRAATELGGTGKCTCAACRGTDPNNRTPESGEL